MLWEEVLHDGKAAPLYTNLRDPQKTRSTLKRANGFAALHICSRCRKNKYVGESACSRGRAQKDEVWGDAFGGSASDDSIMLWEIGHENTEKDEAKGW